MADPRIPGHTIVEWAHDVLTAMGINPSSAAIQVMVTWANHESGGYNPNVAGGLNNPLNTTQKGPGWVRGGGSQGNISDFSSYDAGVRAQAQNLMNPNFGYPAILAALRSSNPTGAYAAIDASSFGTKGLSAGSGTGTSPSGTPGAGGGVSGTNPVGAAPPAKFNLPPGGTLHTVDGTIVVEYRVGNDIVYYDFSAPGVGSRVNTAGTPSGQAYTHAEFYGQKGLIHAGTVDELNSHGAGGAMNLNNGQSYQTWVNNYLLMLSGGNKDMMNDPGVVSIWLQGAAGGWSQEEMDAKLKLTNYWKTHDNAQRNWMTLSPAEQAAQTAAAINNPSSGLRDAYFAATGQQIDPNDKTLKAWALKIASGQSTIGDATWQWLRPLAAKNPQSPWSRTLESEKEQQRQQGVDIGNMGQTVHDQADLYGIKMSPATQATWANQLVTKQKSAADLTKLLTQQATVLYPWAKEQLATGMTTKDISQPWVDTYNRVMEQTTDLFNPKVQAALTQAQPVYDFEKTLKQDPAWLQTTNAHDTLNAATATIGQKMGFVA